MVSKKDKNAQRLKRHARVRGKISGTTERPRLAVYRSNANIYAQIIDDVKGVTLCSASTVEKDFEGIGSNKEAAKKVGSSRRRHYRSCIRPRRLYLSRTCIGARCRCKRRRT